MVQNKLNTMCAAFPRALSILLLAFIICGTTVEAAHNHGNLAGSTQAQSVGHFSDPATEGSINTGSLNCSDCLICQLHQNFSAAVLEVTPNLAPLVISTRRIHFRYLLASSQTSVTRTGRAPPTISC